MWDKIFDTGKNTKGGGEENNGKEMSGGKG